MTFLRSLFFNFLLVFFLNRVIPGIEVTSFETLPNIGADLLYSFLLGLLNASIFFFVAAFFSKVSLQAIVITAFIVSFGGMGIIAGISHGIAITSFLSYFIASFFIWLGSCFTNYLEWKNAVE